MDCQITAFWMSIGIAAASLFCGVLMLWALATGLKDAATALVSAVRNSPAYVALAGLALGALVSYAGTKPPATTYTIRFELPLAFEPMESLTCEPGKVYNLPVVDGCRWKSSASDRLYDGGLLVFDLAQPGETVTMTAIWEDL